MGTTIVTIKATLKDCSLITNALDNYAKWLKETTDSMSPADGRALRGQMESMREMRSRLEL